MAISCLNKMLGDLRRVLAPPEGDDELLLRFVLRRDEGAFTALVRRYGPMVLGVCRRVLRHDQDAEDAFQATFLILARKARSLRRREAVASWLYAVAYRTAQQARVAKARWRVRERQVEVLPEVAVSPEEVQDWRPLLDDELNRLPERYRSPVLLCDLRGQPRRAAALQLGLTDGTLSRRLAAGRRLLAERLLQRGVAFSGGALAVALAREATAALPAGWASITAQGAALVATGQATSLTTPAVFLMNQVLRSMLMTKIKIGVALLLVVVCGAGVAYRAPGQAPPTEPRAVSDMELLRREVELLRLRLERVQQQVQAQQAELQALRGGAKIAPQKGWVRDAVDPTGPATKPRDPVDPTGPATKPRANRIDANFDPLITEAVRAAYDRELQAIYDKERAKRNWERGKDKELPKRGGEKGKELDYWLESNNKDTSKRAGSGIIRDPASRAEAALQALRQAKDERARMRAADELERALRDIRRHLGNDEKAK